MSGIIKVGTGVGMFIMPFFINWLLHNYGWRHSFVVLAFIIIIFVLFLAQFLVRDPVRKAQLIDNGISPASKKHNESEEGLTFKEAIRTRQLWTVCIVYFIILFCVYTILMHIVQHAIDLGISSGIAAGILSTIGGSIGPFMAGYIFDVTISYKIVFLILAILCTIAMALTASLKPLIQKE